MWDPVEYQKGEIWASTGKVGSGRDAGEPENKLNRVNKLREKG